MILAVGNNEGIAAVQDDIIVSSPALLGPLVLGVGDQEYILASDAAAIVSRTQNVVYLKDGELVHITPRAFAISTLDQADVSPVVDTITWKVGDADLNGYAHFMEKEIFEQPQALENTMRGRFAEDGSTAQFGGLNLSAAEFRQIDRLLFCACGSAWHACLVAEHLVESFARVPVEVDYASEFRYRNVPLEAHVINKGSLARQIVRSMADAVITVATRMPRSTGGVGSVGGAGTGGAVGDTTKTPPPPPPPPAPPPAP